MDIKATNARVIEQFRAGEPVEGMHRDRLALLTTVGSRSGLPRTTPMMVNRDGERMLLVASNMGAPRDPDWYNNLVAEPHVTIEVDDPEPDTRYDAVAAPATGEEYERLWARLTTEYPFFLDHAASSKRRIPIVIVTPV
ncbi:nitroreductase/quinone reductase family protein [Compostimonas suwonensis]|uniref:Deazaflavin-dependent oxidoreductase (Nitroreductase family) n=1 Tax=Compostimonas suwonensis TaxID=1048394 RepID=A0A2M9BBF7_9MICO|nr:nitroreductase/quinone reductase family protein [Compostimonas suwonensis]PJJ55277.1 deazaflavin-dependent oxidoreductase (nitroreductase family) [Compostimonas suwonensis]